MIKKTLLLASLLFFSSHAFSQVTLSLKEYDNLKSENVALKNAVDSLKKKLTTVETYNNAQVARLQKMSNDLNDTIKTLRADLSKLEKFKAKKITFESQLKQKNDSIIILRDRISKKDEQILAEKRHGEAKAREEKEIGKKETLSVVVRMYQKPFDFDTLIISSTKETVGRDMQLISNENEKQPKQVLNDLLVYFNAKESLSKKFDATQNKILLGQLKEIKTQSTLLNKLKEDLEDYKNFNNALKETIGELVSLDSLKTADNPELKHNDIIKKLTKYMYNYYDYVRYPYLSDIMLEIIKRKQPNGDADITDLLIKL